MLDCTATGGRKGPNALPLTSCHLTVRNSILASGSGNSPVGSVSITATFPSWTRSLWRSRPSLPTGLNPIIRSDDYAQLLKTFSLATHLRGFWRSRDLAIRWRTARYPHLRDTEYTEHSESRAFPK